MRRGRTVKAEEQAGAKAGQHMTAPEQQSGLKTMENGQASHAQDKCRAAVVAKCQKALGFLPGA